MLRCARGGRGSGGDVEGASNLQIAIWHETTGMAIGPMPDSSIHLIPTLVLRIMN